MSSVFAEITKNLISVLHGKSITYGGSTRTTTCERERFVNVIDDRFPFIVLSGPIVEILNRAHGVVHSTLHYIVTFADNTINDEYDPDESVAPITETMQDVIADLIKLVMVDRTRGGYANNTEYNGAGYYFDDDGDTPLFNIYLQLEIKSITRDTDPYYTGG
jgi:hypothetical protein